ncbi:endolytic transglycosylase MltG [Nocardioides sp. WS12]|uniref:endolytic transglycosylase MltG n=1 Tax=Nocardioides sp. WS12 TaxID=2486272 RepID=UPI0015FB5A12|nr:endolytic transglycosylase MltG [Nocardioides sp. WS12]
MSQSDLPEVGLDAVAPVQHALHPAHDPGHRRAERKPRSGCLPILLVIVLFCAIIAWFARGAISDVKDMFSGPEDYPGPGTGEVEVVIDPGQSIRSMGNELKELDVVASSDAFVDAASANTDAQMIQAATYVMKLQMKAADAVTFLANPANAGSGNTVTVPEGARVGQVVETIVKKTDFTEKQLTALLDKPSKIGLPAEAGGNPEGYLFPATYEITDSTTAQSLLSQMVSQTEAAEKDLQIAAGAERLGLTAHEIITVASILEYEANRGPDYPKVARVIYNRLDDGQALQLDSTVSYASKRKGDVWTTADERDSESLYNTYKHTGLPPGPIGSPGKETIEAALNPAEGNWLYFVPDFEKGTTLFTDSYDEHLRNAEKAKEYCRTHDEC